MFGRGFNDAYDLYLVEDVKGDLVLIIFMKLQFIFNDSSNFKWLDIEKRDFVKKFTLEVNKKWGNMRILKILSTGKIVHIDFRFNTWIGGFSISEHWEIHISKIKKGTFGRSSVNAKLGYVNLDSEDLNYASKGGGFKQRGAIHEFGHMLGLDDEYKVGSPHEKDYSSIMNRAESVNYRHDLVYVSWLDKLLIKHKYQ